MGAFVTMRLLTDHGSITSIRVTSQDALGYYMYLPGAFIYHDLKELKWYPAIDEKYHPTGSFYQAGKYKNGNYVMKYLGGTALMISPFFFVAHYLAPHFHYPQDGFSPPYQLAICFAALLYAFIGLLVLRRVLLYYFDDRIVALTLLLICLGTNLPQYISADSGITHIYLFALYCLQLYVTIRWYSEPKKSWAFAGGLLIGLAAIVRPTDGVMLFIPLLWNEYDKASATSKWQFMKAYKAHFFIVILGTFIATLPQLFYWKYITGHWVYDVGSKWFFLNPFWRVLTGWTNGWLMYTPIVVFFIIGMFLMRGRPFRRSVLVFFLLNTWIIISWSDWRYGGTYSCRALVQSYPVLALAFACAVEWCLSRKWKYFFIPIWVYLVSVNIFQLYQFNAGIIHYNKMNKLYYQAIYLNPDPSPLDFSLLVTDERLHGEDKYRQQTLFAWRDTTVRYESGEHAVFTSDMWRYCSDPQKDYWIRVDLSGVTSTGLWETYLNSSLTLPDTINARKFPLSTPINKENKQTRVSFYQHITPAFAKSVYKLDLSNSYMHQTRIDSLTVRLYSK